MREPDILKSMMKYCKNKVKYFFYFGLQSSGLSIVD
jgi:hypothetical protein